MSPACSQFTLIAYAGLGNAWMLVWASFAGIPILLHLWSRRQQRETNWAAMAFLRAALQHYAKRIRMEQWLLLAIRTLIPIVLALALAEPYLRPSSAANQGLAVAARTHHVLVIDASYSMTAGRDGDTCLDEAKRLALQFVTSQNSEDGFSLIRLADAAHVEIARPILRHYELLAAIRQIEPSQHVGSINSALEAARRLAQSTPDTDPEFSRQSIHVFSDLARGTWREMGPFTALPRVLLHPVSPSNKSNRAITKIHAKQRYLVTGTDVEFQVDVRSFGVLGGNARVQLSVDGTRTAVNTVQLEPGQTTTVRFTHRFERSGTHPVVAQLTDVDILALDNSRFSCEFVRDRVSCLCVSGPDRAGRPVAAALMAGNVDRELFDVIHVDDNEWPTTDTGNFDVIFLCNVQRLSDEVARGLKRHTRSGKGLVVMLGDRTSAFVYNQLLGSLDSPGGILPVNLGDAVPVGAYTVDPRDYAHPLAEPFRGFEQAGLLTMPIWRYVRVEPSRASRVALWFDNGDPFIVESLSPECRTLVVATVATIGQPEASSWSAMGTWPSFPPLVHLLLNQTITDETSRYNQSVGGVIRGSTAPTTNFVTLHFPDGQRSERLALELEDGRVGWSHYDLDRAGIYRVIEDDSSNPIHYAVNVDTNESDLRTIDMESLAPTFQLFRDAPTDRAPPSRGASQPIFRWLLWPLLALLVTESVLAWRFGNRRRSLPPPAVHADAILQL